MVRFPHSSPAVASDSAGPLDPSSFEEPPPANLDPDGLDRLGDRIAELAAHLNAATYRLLVLLRAFDEQGGWEGFRSCAQWLSWRTGLGPGAAREHVRVARALGELPRLSDAMRRGALSYSKARALTRVASPASESELLEFSMHATAAQVERLVRAWRGVDRAEAMRLEEARHARRHLSLRPREDGSWALRGELDPEVGAVLERALRAADGVLFREGRAGAEADGYPPSYGQRQADALGLVVERAFAVGFDPDAEGEGAAPEGEISESRGESPVGQEGRSAPELPKTVGRADRFQVVIHVTEDALGEGEGNGAIGAGPTLGGEFGDDVGVSAETARRLACDASRLVMTHAATGGVLDVGRKSRIVSTAIRRALQRRDGGCRFPGCGSRFCDAHHIEHWASGGKTKIGNLTSLCRRHHRLVHEGGWRVEMSAGGEVRFFRPDGRPLPDVPLPEPVPPDPVGRLQRAHRRAGIEIDPDTAPCWAGDPFDLGFAVDSLWRP